MRNVYTCCATWSTCNNVLLYGKEVNKYINVSILLVLKQIFPTNGNRYPRKKKKYFNHKGNTHISNMMLHISHISLHTHTHIHT